MNERDELNELRRLEELERRASVTPQPQERSWLDVPLEAVKNIPSSAGKFAGGIYQAVTSPLQTLTALGNAAKGGVENIAYNLTQMAAEQRAKTGKPEDAQYKYILERGNTPEMSQADAVGQFYKDRYGGTEELKKTIATDPVGFASDASLALSGGGGLVKSAATEFNLPRVASAAEKAANVGNAINPINVAVQASKPVIQGAGWLGKQALGLTTGVGADTVGAAFKAGKEGATDFYKNLSGQSSMTDVLDQAKAALQKMRQDRSLAYQRNIGTTAADKAKLDFKPIDDALANVADSMKAGKHWKIGDAEVNKIKELSAIVDEWRADPSMHTAMGLDALKQRIDAIYPESVAHTQAQRAITSVRNAVKDTIVKQSPQYAKTVEAYEEAIKLEQEISKALSLGNKSAADTAIRKLQSLTRNNAQANYGYRMELAKALQDMGGQDIMPAVAGQAMSSWMPRGLVGQSQGVATLGAAAIHNPMLLGLLPMQSPKAVGAALYAMGKGKNAIDKFASKSQLTAEQAKMMANLLSQAGKQPQE